MSPSRETVLRWTCVAALAGVAVAAGAVTPASARTVASPSSTATHGTWSQVTKGTISNYYTPDLLRLPEGRLIAAWQQNDGAVSDSAYSAIFTGAKPTSPGTIVAGWEALSSSPQLALINGSLVAAYVGIHTTDVDDATNGPVIAARSADGVTWTQDATPISGDDADGVYGLDLVANGAEPFTGFIPTSTDVVSYHSGAGLTPNFSLPSTDGGNVFDLSLERDTATGAIYAAWFVLGGGNPGIRAQQITPVPGPVLYVTNHDETQPDKAVALTSSTAGGIWVGFQTATSVRMYNAITHKYTNVATKQADVASVDLTAGPSGTIWASWIDGLGGKDVIKAARSTARRTSFGVTSTIPAPADHSGFSNAYTVTSEGSLGSLDVFVSATTPGDPSKVALYHSVVKPALAVHVSASSVSSKHRVRLAVAVGGSVTPKKIVVTFRGHRYTVGKNGTATITVKKGLRSGTYAVTAKAAGYLSATTKVRVHR